MPITSGTRVRQIGFLTTDPETGQATRTRNQDPGLAALVISASITFVGAGTQQAQAANGTFAGFKLNDEIQIGGTNLNNGFFVVGAIDATNSSYLTLIQGVAAEGPVTATVRVA